MGKFDTYGCACRCLLRLREKRGAAIPEDAFLAQFAPLYPHWQHACGLTDTAAICDLGRRLGLGTVQAYRDFAKVRDLFVQPQTSGILVCVERFPDNHGQLNVLYHAMLLEQVDQHSFTLWSPFQDGSAGVLPPFAAPQWETFLAHALVLQT